MSDPTTDVARAVWFLGLLAKRMDRQPDGTAVLALPARYVVALAAYHPEAGAAVYGQPCPICGGTASPAQDPRPGLRGTRYAMTTKATDRPRLCAVCSDEVGPGDQMWLHGPSCPMAALAAEDRVPSALEVRAALEKCGCDLVAHLACHPEAGAVDVMRVRQGVARSLGEVLGRVAAVRLDLEERLGVSAGYLDAALEEAEIALWAAQDRLRQMAATDPEGWRRHRECDDWCPYRGLSGHLPWEVER